MTATYPIVPQRRPRLVIPCRSMQALMAMLRASVIFPHSAITISTSTMTVRSSVKYRTHQIAVTFARKESLTEFSAGLANVELELDQDLVNSALVTACVGRECQTAGKNIVGANEPQLVRASRASGARTSRAAAAGAGAGAADTKMAEAMAARVAKDVKRMAAGNFGKGRAAVEGRETAREWTRCRILILSAALYIAFSRLYLSQRIYEVTMCMREECRASEVKAPHAVTLEAER